MMINKIILTTGGMDLFGWDIIYSRDEMKQWNMAKKFQGDERVRFFIGNVRDILL